MQRLDHVGITVPDIDAAEGILVDVAELEYLYRLAPYRADDSDWMAQHLNDDPRAAIPEIRFFRLGDHAILQVFQYTAPDQRTALPRNSDIGGHHLALYFDDLDAAISYLFEWGVTVLGEPTVSKGAHEGQRWVYFPGSLGTAIRIGFAPER